MAFRILKKVKDGGSTLNSLYQFVPTTIDGVSYYLEFNTKEEVDEYVEEQLNLGLPKTSLEVVAPMKYTVSASIDEEECGCGVPSTNPKPMATIYKIIANPVGGVVEQGSKITFIIDADKSKFVKLIIDGKDVNSNYYVVVSGSTIITLTDIFANTLAIGEHKIEFVFTDGSAIDNFEIVEKKEESIPSDPSEPSDPSGDEEGDGDDTGDEGDEGDTPSDPTNPNPPEGDGDNEDESGGSGETEGPGTSGGEAGSDESTGGESSTPEDEEDTTPTTPETPSGDGESTDTTPSEGGEGDSSTEVPTPTPSEGNDESSETTDSSDSDGDDSTEWAGTGDVEIPDFGL